MPPPNRFPIGPILEDPQMAPPYCDLYIADIDTTLDHDHKQIYLSAVIGNRGTAPPNGPMLTYMEVWSERYRGPQYGWTQDLFREWRWYAMGTSLPFRTLSMSFPFVYEDEGGGFNRIRVEVGDPENRPGDIYLANNWQPTGCGPFARPGTFTEEMQGALRRETLTGDDGKFTSTLTLDGKPLKVTASAPSSTARRK